MIPLTVIEISREAFDRLNSLSLVAVPEGEEPPPDADPIAVMIGPIDRLALECKRLESGMTYSEIILILFPEEEPS